MDTRDDSRAMLLDAFASEQWPAAQAAIAMIPGGFMRTRLPDDYDGARGWDSRKRDLAKLIPYAQPAIEHVMHGKVLERSRARTRLLTLGVDRNMEHHKEDRIRQNHYCRPSCPPSCTHAELVAVFDTASAKIVRWTGKSYPVDKQQHTLIHVKDLRSHLLKIKTERLLVLGCHDLNLLIDRGRKPKHQLSPKQVRRERIQRLAREFKPTIILHHPHSTYSPNIWRSAWGAARATLPTTRIALSGIAFCGNPQPEPKWRPWQTLDTTLRATSCGDGIIDVVINGCGS